MSWSPWNTESTSNQPATSPSPWNTPPTSVPPSSGSAFEDFAMPSPSPSPSSSSRSTAFDPHDFFESRVVPFSVADTLTTLVVRKERPRWIWGRRNDEVPTNIPAILPPNLRSLTYEMELGPAHIPILSISLSALKFLKEFTLHNTRLSTITSNNYTVTDALNQLPLQKLSIDNAEFGIELLAQLFSAGSPLATHLEVLVLKNAFRHRFQGSSEATVTESFKRLKFLRVLDIENAPFERFITVAKVLRNLPLRYLRLTGLHASDLEVLPALFPISPDATYTRNFKESTQTPLFYTLQELIIAPRNIDVGLLFSQCHLSEHLSLSLLSHNLPYRRVVSLPENFTRIKHLTMVCAGGIPPTRILAFFGFMSQIAKKITHTNAPLEILASYYPETEWVSMSGDIKIRPFNTTIRRNVDIFTGCVLTKTYFSSASGTPPLFSKHKCYYCIEDYNKQRKTNPSFPKPKPFNAVEIASHAHLLQDENIILNIPASSNLRVLRLSHFSDISFHSLSTFISGLVENEHTDHLATILRLFLADDPLFDPKQRIPFKHFIRLSKTDLYDLFLKISHLWRESKQKFQNINSSSSKPVLASLFSNLVSANMLSFEAWCALLFPRYPSALSTSRDINMDLFESLNPAALASLARCFKLDNDKTYLPPNHQISLEGLPDSIATIEYEARIHDPWVLSTKNPDPKFSGFMHEVGTIHNSNFENMNLPSIPPEKMARIRHKFLTHPHFLRAFLTIARDDQFNTGVKFTTNIQDRFYYMAELSKALVSLSLKPDVKKSEKDIHIYYNAPTGVAKTTHWHKIPEELFTTINVQGTNISVPTIPTFYASLPTRTQIFYQLWIKHLLIRDLHVTMEDLGGIKGASPLFNDVLNQISNPPLE